MEQIKDEVQNVKPWNSRLFLIGVVMLICITVLVGLNKLQMDAGTITTVFLGIMAAVAGISRRGSDLRPQVQGSPIIDSGGAQALLAGLGPLFAQYMANTPISGPVSARDVRPPVAIPPWAIRLDEIPPPEKDLSAEDYYNLINDLVGEAEVYVVPKAAEPQDAEPGESPPEEKPEGGPKEAA